jgi:outer membrane receptor protein involved in Fe transport
MPGYRYKFNFYLEGKNMNAILKRLYMFTVLAVFTTFSYADNPGTDEAETTAPVQVEAQEEVVVAEETASTSSSESADEEVVQLEKVVVTGSRLKRTEVSGALPLIVITKEDMDASGFRNITEALQALPQANAYNQNEQMTNSFTPNANSLNLRNIGPSKTLYLINGRRTADYPLPYNNAGNIVNTSTIPSGLIDRIEVLSQGSSAIYGSDAIGGVVNIITKDGMDYSQLEADVSVMEHGDNDAITSLTFSTGGFFGSSSWTVGFDVSHVDPMYLSDREGFDSWKDNPDYGEEYANPRWGAAFQTTSWYSGADTATYSPQDIGYDCNSQALSGGAFELFSRDKPDVYGTTNYGGSYQGYACMYGRGAEGGDTQTIVNERDDATFMGTFNHSFANGVELKSRLYYFEEEAYFRSDVSRYVSLGDTIDSRIADAVAAGNDLVPAGNPAYRASYILRYFTPAMGEAFENRRDYEEDMTDFFIGLNGITEGGYEWQLGFNQTNYNMTYAATQLTQGASDYMAGVGHTDADGNLSVGWYAGDPCQDDKSGMGGLLAGFGIGNCFIPERIYGEISPELFNSWLADDSVNAESYQRSFDFVLSGETTLMSKPLAFAVTAEYAYQDYEVIPSAGRLDDEVYGGDDAIKLTNGSTRYGFGDRKRKSAGIEVAYPLTDSLEVTAATRVDNYDDDSSNVGTAKSSMINFAWRPNEDFLLRGSWGETFRAPDMHYIYSQPSSVFSYGTDYTRCYAEFAAGNTDSVASQPILCGEQGTYSEYFRTFQEGNQNLEEEFGYNYSLGFVWQITEELSLQWDAYQVYLENSVAQESNTAQILAEGVCRYGSAFTDWYDLSDNIPERDCDTILSRIDRSAPQALPGDTLPDLGDINSINRDPRNQGFIEYIGHDTYVRWNKETENAGDFSVTVGSVTIDHINLKSDPYGDQLEVLTSYIYEPRSRQNATIGYKYQKHNASIGITRMGHMNISRRAGGGSTSDPWIRTNVSYWYDYSPDVDAYISIRNIEDKMPLKDGGYSYPFYQQGYYSALGRYVSVGVTYRF